MTDIQNDPDDILWHYTSFSGLQGIIEQGAIWASHLAYLNDMTEFAYSVDIFASVLNAALDGYHADAFPLTHRALAQQADSLSKWTDGVRVFITCFSRARDDLSQWRAYAGRAPGFSIGFDRIELEKLVKLANFSLEDCAYDPVALRKELDVLLTDWILEMEQQEPFSRQLTQTSNVDFHGMTLTAKMASRLVKLAQINKHPSFSAEREVRVIGFCDPRDYDPHDGNGLVSEIRYRQAGSLIVPYFGLKLSLPGHPLPIKEIVVGPCPHQAAVVRAIRQFAEQWGVHAEVKPSSVPFRNW